VAPDWEADDGEEVQGEHDESADLQILGKLTPDAIGQRRRVCEFRPMISELVS
jgi:hypothetical protein